MTALAELAVAAALGALMAAIALSDWRRYRVPDRLTALALGLRGVSGLIEPSDARLDDLAQAAFRAVAVAALFYFFRVAYRRARGREGLGLGDVKLAAVAGAWVDWPLLPFVVEAAALFGLGLALARAFGRGAAPRWASTSRAWTT